MKLKCLSYPLAFSLVASLLVACGGSDTPPVTPPPAEPPPAPVQSAAPAETVAAVMPSAAPAEPPPMKEEAPAPKPLKEKLVGVWVLDFSGEMRTTAEADAKKKAGKDEKKLADLMKKAEETAAKEKIENTSDMIILWDGTKTTSKAKYEVVKEEASTITVKRVGKDEISKKDAPAAEIVITFKDDNTIELKDIKEKDAKKAKTLVFKKSAASSMAPAAPAAPATDKGGSTPAKPTGKPAPAAPPAKK